MASSADIANLALLKLGSGSKITSLTDGTPAAQAMNRAYDLIRKAELRGSHWSFALTRTELPVLATAPAWGFARSFALPADFLRVVQVNDCYQVPGVLNYNNGDASPYALEIQGGAPCILTDYGDPLKLRYVRDATDEGTFDALFVVSFATRLAFEVCEQITNSNSKKQALRQDYADSIKAAARAGAIEKPPALIGDDSWMMARL